MFGRTSEYLYLTQTWNVQHFDHMYK